jgi:hypothetical protein
MQPMISYSRGAQMNNQAQLMNVPEAESVQIDNVNAERIELLIRRYVCGQLSTEEEVRLEIVAERIRRLMPKVSAENFEELEAIITEINEIGDADDQLRQELGLTDRK